MFAGNFAPAGWAFCDGQPLPISENDALFTLIGTTYGGDGQETFNLPDLESRAPVHAGSGYTLGEHGGAEEVTLTAQQIPTHTHSLMATKNLATSGTPSGNTLATTQASTITLYGTDQPTTAMNPASVAPTGGSQPHSNLQPYLAVNFIISLFGVYPTPT
jgi:microcystin-dependent protein